MQERRLIQLLGRAVGCVVNADAASLKYCDRSWFRAPARVMFDNWHTECGTSLFLEVLFILLRSSSFNLYVALAALQLYYSPPAGGIL